MPGINSMPETSALAFDSIQDKPGKPIVSKLLKMVLNHIIMQGGRGSTCDEAETALKLSHQTCSARFNGLMNLGLIKATDEKRKTRSRRFAMVYRATVISPPVAS